MRRYFPFHILLIVLIPIIGVALFFLLKKQKLVVELPEPPAPVSYNFEILPIFKEKCASCHENQSELTSLQQDLTALEKPLVIPGKPESSPLYKTLSAAAAPHHKVTPAELDLFNRWITLDGHPAPHWATLPLQPVIPKRHHFNDESDFLNWTSQVSKKLMGDYPNQLELETATHAFQENRVKAPEIALNRIFALNAYANNISQNWRWMIEGEETAHIDEGLRAHAMWVHHAFAKNLPIDEFIRDQIAGDLKENASLDDRIASGFLRKFMVKNRANFLAKFLLADPTHQYPAVFQAKYENPDRPVMFMGEPLQLIPPTTPEYAEKIQQLNDINKRLRELPTLRNLDFQNWLQMENKVSVVPNLLALYPFDAKSPYKSSGIEPAGEGTAPGLPTAKGIRGKAPVFDGRQLITFDQSISTRPYERFSISAWLKIEKHSSQPVVIFSNTSNPRDANQGLFFILQKDTLQATFAIEIPGNSISQKSDSLPIPPQIWHHFALTYDGSHRSSGLKIYLNGQKLRTTQVERDILRPLAQIEPPEASTSTLYLGGHPRLLGFENGVIDELTLHQRDLTPIEIQELAIGNALNNPKTKPDSLRSYYFAVIHPEARQLIAERDQLRREIDSEQALAWHAAIMLAPDEASKERLTIANDLIANPQFARVMANRFHILITGRRLVETPDDFSPTGVLPKNPGLLDFYANTLVSSGWDLQKLITEILLHEEFPFTSSPAPTEQSTPADSSVAYPPQNDPTAPRARAKVDTSFPPAQSNSASPATESRPANVPRSR